MQLQLQTDASEKGDAQVLNFESRQIPVWPCVMPGFLWKEKNPLYGLKNRQCGWFEKLSLFNH